VNRRSGGRPERSDTSFIREGQKNNEKKEKIREKQARKQASKEKPAVLSSAPYYRPNPVPSSLLIRCGVSDGSLPDVYL
jgi:hypothetical protein